MSEDLDQFKKSKSIFNSIFKYKKFLIIPSLLFLIIFNIYNFFAPKMYNVKLYAKIIDDYKFIKLNDFVSKNKIKYQINSINLTDQIADSFTDYGEIEEAVREYSEVNNNSQLTKDQKDKLIIKLTQSYFLDTVNNSAPLRRVEKLRPYKLHNRFDFLIQFKTENVNNSKLILDEAIKKINQDINETNKDILNNLVNARLIDLETDLNKKNVIKKIIKNNILEKNATDISILEEQLKLVNLQLEQENFEQKQKNNSTIKILEEQLKLVNLQLEQENFEQKQKNNSTIKILEEQLKLVNLQLEQKNNSTIKILEEQLKLVNLQLEQENFEQKQKNNSTIKSLEEQLKLINTQQEKEKLTRLNEINKNLLKTLKTKTNPNIKYNYNIPNSLQNQNYRKLEIEKDLIKAKNLLKDKSTSSKETKLLKLRIEKDLIKAKNLLKDNSTSSNQTQASKIEIEKDLIKAKNLLKDNSTSSNQTQASKIEIEKDLIKAKNLSKTRVISSKETDLLEVKKALIKAKNLKDKLLYDNEYRELQGDIEMLNLQINNIKDTFDKIIKNSPFYKNENIINLEKSTIIIENPNDLLNLIRKNLSILLIGIFFGLFLILYKERQTIFR